jgi:hypothetical protein
VLPAFTKQQVSAVSRVRAPTAWSTDHRRSRAQAHFWNPTGRHAETRRVLREQRRAEHKDKWEQFKNKVKSAVTT